MGVGMVGVELGISVGALVSVGAGVELCPAEMEQAVSIMAQIKNMEAFFM